MAVLVGKHRLTPESGHVHYTVPAQQKERYNMRDRGTVLFCHAHWDRGTGPMEQGRDVEDAVAHGPVGPFSLKTVRRTVFQDARTPTNTVISSPAIASSRP
jgi:hypothetical protein